MNGISVIIPTKNRAQFLKDALLSLLSNTVLPEEIIIVDQGDGDETKAIVETIGANYKELVYLKDCGKGRSCALNLGIRKSKEDIVAFTDDDCIIPKDWISSFKKEIKNLPDFSAITGRVLAEPGFEAKEFLNLVRSTKRKETNTPRNPWKIGCVGCNMFVKKEAIIDIGLFDEYFGVGSFLKGPEDADIIYRILKAGKRVIYCPDIFVYHKAWREKEDNIILRYEYAFSLGVFAGKYFLLGDLYPFWFIFCRFLQKVRRLIVGIVIFDKDRISDGYLHLKGITLGFLKILSYSLKNGRKNISNNLHKK